MTAMAFFLSIISTSLFAVAFLWVIASWFKRGEETVTVERATQTTREALTGVDCVEPRAGCCLEYDRLAAARSGAN